VSGLSRRGENLVAGAAVVLLTVLSLLAVGLLGTPAGPGPGGGPGGRPAAGCTVPALTGTQINVTLTNMGGPVMRPRNGMMGGAMRLRADRGTVTHGTVSFLVTNAGNISHEMVILPLPDNQVPGTRPVGPDGTIDESGSLGEVSASCSEGSGEGILPGTSGWVTLTLPPGRYELACNLPGHYEAGMYTQLTVT